MKTTIELPDELLIEAKAEAARRRSTLKEMFENALRRELSHSAPLAADSPLELNTHGFPVLKSRGGNPITSEQVYDLIENEDR